MRWCRTRSHCHERPRRTARCARRVLFQMATQRSTFATDILSRGPETPDFDDEHHDPIVIMVTSAAPKEGKTTSSANLAAVFAEAGADVLVVNCDFRRPMIHQYLGVADQARRVHNSVIPHVKVVTNVVTETDPNPARVVAAQRQLVEAAKQQFDVVLLDTAPLLSANDAVELVGETDLVLMVARADISTSPSARRAMEILGRVDAPVAGVLLVGASEASNEYYGYYYYDQRSSVGEAAERACSAQGGQEGKEGRLGQRPRQRRGTDERVGANARRPVRAARRRLSGTLSVAASARTVR